MFEAEYLASPRIDPDITCRTPPSFPPAPTGLKKQQRGMTIGRVEKLLLRTQFRDVLFNELLILFLRFVYGIDLRWLDF